VKRIVYVLRSYPRASQTFVLNEILTAERLGADIEIVALSRADDRVHQPVADRISASVAYLDERLATRRQIASLVVSGLVRWRWRFAATLASVVASAGVDRGYTSEGRLRCFLHAVALATRLPSTPPHSAPRRGRDAAPSVHLHAHFAHDPAYVALLAARLTGVTYSFTGHARDLYQIEPDLLAERVAAAEFVVTVTDHNRQVMRRAAPAVDTPIHVLPQGTDTEVFTPAAVGQGGPPVLLAIGRLVPKKGFDLLVAACGRLNALGYRFRCVIVGDGPEAMALLRAITEGGLAELVSIAEPRAQAELVDVYRSGDVFALPAVVTAEGDSDALPTVLLEAMACSLPVVTTPVGGIAELVTDGIDGLLVEPGDVEGLADGVARLLDDPALRHRLGVAARSTVVDRFDHHRGVARLLDLFAAVDGTGASPPTRLGQAV
jgi:glycosyltransferase involved in cell wall biosynthesis